MAILNHYTIMSKQIFTFEYPVNGHPGQKEIVAKNKNDAVSYFLLWIDRNFPWASPYDFDYELVETV